MDRLRDLAWKFWPLYFGYKNWRHGRGQWTDWQGYREFPTRYSSGYIEWEWEEVSAQTEKRD